MPGPGGKLVTNGGSRRRRSGAPLGPREGTRLLGKLLKRSERSLRKSWLAEAAELFGDSPKRSTKKLARKARDDIAARQEDANAA
ncbi:CHAD domain containing protein [Mesorhizobium loti]|nr:CHAD domain containing protein [Mesorhizobium loti]